jgi:hypothetical protein
MPGKNVLGRRSGLRTSEKERPERRFGAFRHKKYPWLLLIVLPFINGSFHIHV